MTDADLAALLSTRTETRNLDYKEAIHWSEAASDEKVGLVKDILAMANTPTGGKIVLGVRDADFEPVGLARDAFESLDQTRTNDFLHRYTDPRFSCQVHKLSVDGRLHVVIEVAEFPIIPIICRADANSTKGGKLLLRRGCIYTRTEKATSEPISTSDEMRELLEIALTKRETALISTIQNLVSRQPTVTPHTRTPGEPARASSIPNLTLEDM
jgi:predicted HTH transcriptional regulator